MFVTPYWFLAGLAGVLLFWIVTAIDYKYRKKTPYTSRTNISRDWCDSGSCDSWWRNFTLLIFVFAKFCEYLESDEVRKWMRTPVCGVNKGL